MKLLGSKKRDGEKSVSGYTSYGCGLPVMTDKDGTMSLAAYSYVSEKTRPPAPPANPAPKHSSQVSVLIGSLDNVSVKNTDDDGLNPCAICLESLTSGDSHLTLGATTPCGHCFHELCWARYHASTVINNKRKSVTECAQCKTPVHGFTRIFLEFPPPDGDDQATVVEKSYSAKASEIVGKRLWVGSEEVVASDLTLLLGTMCTDRDASFSQKIAQKLLEMGAMVAVVRAMERFKCNENVMLDGFGIVLRMLRVRGAYQLLYETSGSLEVITAGMLQHKKNHVIQLGGCNLLRLIWNYPRLNERSRRYILRKGVEASLMAVKENYKNKELLQDVLALLSAVAFFDDHCASKLKRIPVVVSTLAMVWVKLRDNKRDKEIASQAKKILDRVSLAM